ncbi:MAG: ribonuclease P protein component [Bacteroidales bacterium]|nr:ribonuclease P protein component [Bacteroidales bacterium]
MTDRTFGWRKKLRKTDEFSSVFHFRCYRRGKVLDVNAGPNQLGFARLGLIVPKKVISTAAGRNRVKRLLREWFRLSQSDLDNVDIIARLKAKTGAHHTDETALKEDFLSGLAVCKACIKSRAFASNDSD